MDPKFATLVEHLEPKLQALRAMAPLSRSSLPVDMPKRGVYLFSDGDKHLYVGRSNDLRGRYGRHCRPGATYKQAAFAFQLAREATNNPNATYKTEGSRAWLIKQPAFVDAFNTAKARIRAMDYRYVE